MNELHEVIFAIPIKHENDLRMLAKLPKVRVTACHKPFLPVEI